MLTLNRKQGNWRIRVLPSNWKNIVMIALDFTTLYGIGFKQHVVSQLAATSPGHRLARVTEVQRDWLTVDDGKQAFSTRALRYGEPAVVGDWVLLAASGGAYWIDTVLDPSTRLTRRTPSGRQALASNVDTALLLMGLDQDFNPRRMERTIALVRACGVAPVMVLTKSDIGTDAADKFVRLRERIPDDVPALALHPARQTDTGLLAPWLGVGRRWCCWAHRASASPH